VRLFIAVNLPDDVRRDIHQAAAPLRRPGLPVKWVDPEGVHLTLKFLGGVEQERLPAVEAALERACRGARPFTVALGGFGAFPTPTRARVIWVGCEPAPPLELLQHAVEREFAELGFPVEGRPFRPHLTLGRAGPRAHGGVPGLEAPLSQLEFSGEVVVRSVELMESALSRGGARYAVRRSVSLDA
jgi:2'-5' RNA ligase